jgi:hypothetical protein
MTAVSCLVAGFSVFSYDLGTFPSAYLLEVMYDGYLPVLGGLDQQAKVDIELAVTPVSEVGKPAGAKTSLRALQAFLRDIETKEWVSLGFNRESVLPFFPDSTVRVEPRGKILSTDMPKANLPFRLPGLDLQHIPDVTFLFLEFPEVPLVTGTPWRFVRKFNDSEVVCDATLVSSEGGAATFAVEIRQTYESYEDENSNPVVDVKEAVQRVATAVRGAGKVRFQGNPGGIASLDVTATAESIVYPLKGGAEQRRTLKTTFKLTSKRQ